MACDEMFIMRQELMSTQAAQKKEAAARFGWNANSCPSSKAERVMDKRAHHRMEREEGEGEAEQECESDDGDVEAAGVGSCWGEQPVQHARQRQRPNVAAHCEGQQAIQIPATP